jgi:hypothetical protein
MKDRAWVCPHCGYQHPQPLPEPTLVWRRYVEDHEFLYCDRDGRMLTLSYGSDLWRVVEIGCRLNPKVAYAEALESIFAPCPCGGKFRLDARPRCPACDQPAEIAHFPLNGEIAAEEVFLRGEQNPFFATLQAAMQTQPPRSPWQRLGFYLLSRPRQRTALLAALLALGIIVPMLCIVVAAATPQFWGWLMLGAVLGWVLFLALSHLINRTAAMETARSELALAAGTLLKPPLSEK